MRKMILIVLLAGCVPNSDTCESSECLPREGYFYCGADMDCGLQTERIVQLWQNLAGPIQPRALLPNTDGCEVLSLGSADTTGAVKVTPLIAQGTSLKSFVVAANAPYVGFLKGPLQIDPIEDAEFIGSGVTNPVSYLDIIAFKRAPPFMPTRAPLDYYANTPTGNTFYFPVRGRKRVSAIGVPVSGTVTITAYRAIQSTGYTLDSKTGAGGATVFADWDGVGNQAAAFPPVSTIDYIAIAVDAAGFSRIGIEAWDF